MRNSKIILSFFVLILILNVASAADLSASITIIGNDALATYEFSSFSDSLMRIELPEHSQILDVILDDRAYNPKINDNILIINRSFNTLKINFKNSLLVESNNKKYFTFNQKMPFEGSFKLQLILPESAYLTSSDSAYPKPQITSDGLHIILDWESDLKKGESFSAFVIYLEKTEFSFSSLLIWIILILAVASAVYFLLIPYIRKRAGAKDIKAELMESERKIVNILKKSKGELWQKQIQLQTEFSKAKLSRLIRDLEAREVIKKIPIGNTNKIRLIQ